MGQFDFTSVTTPIKLHDHHKRHEDGGADEVSLTGLSGDLADLQDPKDHTHQSAGSGVGGQLDHGAALTGLGDDDHTQYQKETDFTAGSVLFRGSSVITEDNSNLFWDDTNKVLGIGTNNPAQSSKLTVEGDIFLINNTGDPRIVLGDSTGAGNWGGIRWNSSSDYIGIGTSGANIDAIVIKENGNVGIGTASPNSKLEVTGEVAITGADATFNDNYGTVFGTGDDAAIYYNNTSLVIDPDAAGSGIVLIGVTGDDDLEAYNITAKGNISVSGTLTVSGDATFGGGLSLAGGKAAFGGNTDWGTGATGTLIDGSGYDWVTQTVGRVNANLNGCAAAAHYAAMTITANQTSSNSIFGHWVELYVKNSVDLTGADNFAAIWGQFEAGTGVTLSDTGCFTAGLYANVKAGSTLTVASGHSLNGVRAQIEVSAITNNGTTAAFECLKSGGVDWEFGLYLADVTTDIRFQEGTTLTDDGTNLTLAGANLALHSGADLTLYSDAGSTVKAHIDGATGHIGFGGQSASGTKGIYYNEAVSVDDGSIHHGVDLRIDGYRTTSSYGGTIRGCKASAIVAANNTQDWTRTVGVQGFYSRVETAGGSSSETITGAACFYASPTFAGGADDTIVTNYYGLYVEPLTSVGNSKLTNDYGIYVANQAGGATLNYAIYTNAGLVRFGGATTINADLTVDNLITSGNVDGVDVSAHDVATTGVHGISGTIVGTSDSQALTNKSYNGLTLTSTTGTFTLASGKTFTVSNTLTLTATDTATLAIGGGGTLGTAAYTATTAYEASGAISTHATDVDAHVNGASSGQMLIASAATTAAWGNSPDINGGTIGGVTLDGAIAGGNQAFTGVGDMTFTAGSILAAGSTNNDTLLLKAGGLTGTTFITLTSDTTDTMILGKSFFYDAGGESIESNGTNLTISSGALINLTATSDVVIPVSIGLHFGDGAEKIESNNTDLTINSGGDIALTATDDVNIPVNVGLEFAGTEKIESDGTDLSITVGANGDINVGADIGITFGDDGEKIEGDGTDLTISSSGVLTLSPTGNLVLGSHTGVLRGDSGVVSVDGDVTDLVAAASTTVSGIVELAIGSEVNTGTSTTLAVTPDALDDWTGSAQLTTLGTIGSGTWEGTAVAATYIGTHASTHTNGTDDIQDTSTSQKGIVQLDDTAGGTNAEVAKPPTSNVMYDHGANTTTAHGAVSAATASKHVVRDASARAKFAQSAAAGDVIVADANNRAPDSTLLEGSSKATVQDHTPKAHTIVSHSDTTATGANLNTLVGGGETALHSHADGAGSTVVWKDASERALADLNRTTTQNWTDLDLTALTSANAKIALVKLMIIIDSVTAGAANYGLVAIRKNGTTPSFYPYPWVDGGTYVAGSRLAQIAFIGIDTDEVLEYYIECGGTIQIDSYIDVLGYIE